MEEAEAFNSRDIALILMPGSSKTFFCRFSRNSAVRAQSDRRSELLSSSHSLVVSITIRSSVELPSSSQSHSGDNDPEHSRGVPRGDAAFVRKS